MYKVITSSKTCCCLSVSINYYRCFEGHFFPWINAFLPTVSLLLINIVSPFKKAQKKLRHFFRGNRSIPDFEVQHLPYAVIIFIIIVLWPKWPFMSMAVKWELPKFGSKVSMRFESLMASQAMFLDPPTLHLIISFKVGFTWTWLWKIIAKKFWKMWFNFCLVIFEKHSSIMYMLMNFTLGQNWSVWEVLSRIHMTRFGHDLERSLLGVRQYFVLRSKNLTRLWKT